jgi:hypothetical protein
MGSWHQDRLADWLSVVMWLTLTWQKTDEWQTRPLGREVTPQRQSSKFEKKNNSGYKSQSGLDTKTYWLTDRRSQCDFDFAARGREIWRLLWSDVRLMHSVATSLREVLSEDCI